VASSHPAPRPAPAGVRLRREIEKAEAEGVARSDMTLHLTLGDVNQLMRDRSLPVADISYVGGTMSYLGVEIVRGGVPASVLRRAEAE